jgi:GTPase SAR1 family protein
MPCVVKDHEKLQIDDILQHQKAALSSGQLPFNRSRVMVVGQGRVGKTTLLRRLLGEPFNPNEQSTVGAVTQDIDAKVSNLYTTILFVLQSD